MTKETYLYNKELHDIHIGRSKWSTAVLEELSVCSSLCTEVSTGKYVQRLAVAGLISYAHRCHNSCSC